jgi:hypothetical protein
MAALEPVCLLSSVAIFCTGGGEGGRGGGSLTPQVCENPPQARPGNQAARQYLPPPPPQPPTTSSIFPTAVFLHGPTRQGTATERYRYPLNQHSGAIKHAVRLLSSVELLWFLLFLQVFYWHLVSHNCSFKYINMKYNNYCIFVCVWH